MRAGVGVVRAESPPGDPSSEGAHGAPELTAERQRVYL